jgi:hypothetical protein
MHDARAWGALCLCVSWDTDAHVPMSRKTVAIRDRVTGRPRGFGLVIHSSKARTAAAVEQVSEHDVDNRKFRADLANSRVSDGGSGTWAVIFDSRTVSHKVPGGFGTKGYGNAQGESDYGGYGGYGSAGVKGYGSEQDGYGGGGHCAQHHRYQPDGYELIVDAGRPDAVTATALTGTIKGSKPPRPR